MQDLMSGKNISVSEHSKTMDRTEADSFTQEVKNDDFLRDHFVISGVGVPRAQSEIHIKPSVQDRNTGKAWNVNHGTGKIEELNKAINRPADYAEDISMMQNITKVLEEGDIFSVNNETVGAVNVKRGSLNHDGIVHIAKRRMEERTFFKERNMSVPKAQEETSAIIFLAVKNVGLNTAVEEKNGAYAVYKNGIKTIIGKDSGGKYILTGFDFDKNKQEATDSIKSVIDHYRYTPEFLGIYTQVGAVYSSLYPNITQSSEKSIGNGPDKIQSFNIPADIAKQKDRIFTEEFMRNNFYLPPVRMLEDGRIAVQCTPRSLKHIDLQGCSSNAKIEVRISKDTLKKEIEAHASRGYLNNSKGFKVADMNYMSPMQKEYNPDEKQYKELYKDLLEPYKERNSDLKKATENIVLPAVKNTMDKMIKTLEGSSLDDGTRKLLEGLKALEQNMEHEQAVKNHRHDENVKVQVQEGINSQGEFDWS